MRSINVLCPVNMEVMSEPEGASKSYSPLEIQGLARGHDFSTRGNAYGLVHATRPSTIGFVIGSNPIALLAWSAFMVCSSIYINISKGRRKVSDMVRYRSSSRDHSSISFSILVDRNISSFNLYLSSGAAD